MADILEESEDYENDSEEVREHRLFKKKCLGSSFISVLGLSKRFEKKKPESATSKCENAAKTSSYPPHCCPRASANRIMECEDRKFSIAIM